MGGSPSASSSASRSCHQWGLGEPPTHYLSPPVCICSLAVPPRLSSTPSPISPRSLPFCTQHLFSVGFLSYARLLAENGSFCLCNFAWATPQMWKAFLFLFLLWRVGLNVFPEDVLPPRCLYFEQLCRLCLYVFLLIAWLMMLAYMHFFPVDGHGCLHGSVSVNFGHCISLCTN